jgi:hypothetical protein
LGGKFFRYGFVPQTGRINLINLNFWSRLANEENLTDCYHLRVCMHVVKICRRSKKFCSFASFFWAATTFLPTTIEKKPKQKRRWRNKSNQFVYRSLFNLMSTTNSLGTLRFWCFFKGLRFEIIFSLCKFLVNEQRARECAKRRWFQQDLLTEYRLPSFSRSFVFLIDQNCEIRLKAYVDLKLFFFITRLKGIADDCLQ